MIYPPELTASFKAIKNIDPSLYDFMQDTEWDVRTVHEPREIFAPLLAVRSDPHEVTKAAKAFDSWAGITAGNVTLVNLPSIERERAYVSTSFADFTANVLAHEFVHVLGGEEPPAYQASVYFALMQGNRPLAAYFADMAERMTPDGKLSPWEHA